MPLIAITIYHFMSITKASLVRMILSIIIDIFYCWFLSPLSVYITSIYFE